MSVDTTSKEIPDGWKTAAIGDVCKVVSGSTPKTSVSEYWNGNIPWLTPNDLSKNRSKVVNHGERSITQNGFDSCSTQMVPEGSVLFTSRAPIGYVAIAGAPMCTNQGFKSAVPSEAIGTEFLYWQLQNLTDDIRSRASGTTFLEISGRGFAATNLVIPPLTEQEKIVEILEEQLSRLEAALASVRVVREKAVQFRRSLLHAAFTGALSGNTVSSGALPDKWNELPLVDVVTFKNGYAYKSSDWLDTGVPVVKIANVGNGEVTLDNCSHISHELANQTSEFKVEDGDFLIALSGVTLGNCGVFRHSEISRMNQRVARIRLKPDCGVLEKILEYYFESPEAFRSIWSAAKGAAQPNISTKSMELFRIPLAPIKEQQELVEVLDEQFSRLNSALLVAGTIEKKAIALRRSLLHAAFTGNLTKEWREGAHV